MDATLGYAVALAAVLVYGLVVYALWRAGKIGPDRHLTLLGPALMLKTQRGRAALDRWARFPRFWTALSDLGIALAAIAMGAIVALLLFGAVASTRLSAAQAPPVTEAVGLPGINPVIPLGYGIVALVVGIVLHELSHGVVARSQKIGVKSLGILWCVVPVGAFVEQDDADMTGASRRRRDRVAAAGVLANFLLAVVFFVALSAVVATSVAPNASGVGIAAVEQTLPGTSNRTPAAQIGLAAGDIIVQLNGTATPTLTDFEDAIARTVPGTAYALVYYAASNGSYVPVTVRLATDPANHSRGFLGVEVFGLTPAQLRQTLVWPFGSSAGPLVGPIDWLILPLATIEPIGGTSASFFHLVGPLAHSSPSGFWVGANVLYWLAWMNLLLGLSNALPLVPLDGGLLFRDFATSVAARFRRGWSSQRLEAFAGRASAAASVLVLVLLVWQFVVPRLG
ncbi:MAG TPA: site-2 protease family protein [Thermoplasmata archaeon]|nr:site-2 protease family protein [Thermoplasmata archaeon]